jgi:hypothetical protein
MWFLNNKVLLTNDNLIKRKWQGIDKCCLCDQKETVEHLFIQCPLAKMVWRIVHMTFNISPPKKSRTCLAIGWPVCLKKENHTFEWVHVL